MSPSNRANRSMRRAFSRAARQTARPSWLDIPAIQRPLRAPLGAWAAHMVGYSYLF